MKNDHVDLSDCILVILYLYNERTSLPRSSTACDAHHVATFIFELVLQRGSIECAHQEQIHGYPGTVGR